MKKFKDGSTTRRTADILFVELCDKIDELKLDVMYWKKEYEEMRNMHTKQVNDSIEDNKKMIGFGLSLVLNASEDIDGNLVIAKQNRKGIAETLKK